MKNAKLFLFILAFCYFAGFSSAQDTLLMWTFPTGTNADSLATESTSINPNCKLHVQGGTSVIDFSKNGLTTKAAQAIGWDNGAGTKCWVIEFKTDGYTGIKVSSVQQSGATNPGPKDFKLQYKVGSGGTWTDVTGGTITCANDWTTGVLNHLALPAATDNQSVDVYLRWIMSTDSNISGGIVASNGISKIDNIMITGTKMPSGINNLTENVFNIWPNPSSGLFHIKNTEKINSIEIMSVSGEVLNFNDFFTGSSVGDIDLTAYKKGIYFIRFTGDKKTEIKKILVK